MEKFKCGDVVRLKSGGPLMTVMSDEQNQLPTVYCCWFNRDKKVERDEFVKDMLVKVENKNT